MHAVGLVPPPTVHVADSRQAAALFTFFLLLLLLPLHLEWYHGVIMLLVDAGPRIDTPSSTCLPSFPPAMLSISRRDKQQKRVWSGDKSMLLLPFLSLVSACNLRTKMMKTFVLWLVL